MTAQLFTGNVAVTGAYEGNVVIYSGFMAWSNPVADATTYWQLQINLDGEQVCIWSGAETGPCPGL